jgi:signal transduction histidine kinase
MLLAVAFALLLAQGIGAMLVYRAQAERREAGLIHTAAFRLLSATRSENDDRGDDDSRVVGPVRDGPVRDGSASVGAARKGEARPARRHEPPGFGGRGRGFRVERATVSPLKAGEARDGDAEAELRRVLADQDLAATEVHVTRRDVRNDPVARQRLARQPTMLTPDRRNPPSEVIVAAVKLPDARWLVARVFVPAGERAVVLTLIGQTLLIYALLVGVIAFILRRITRPLAALTERLDRFAETRSVEGQLEPQGPADVRQLIIAHNAMEARIVAMLDEKDVMLGAIGHDLKTPLAALRVRIESVENEAERERMAATIEDIVRSLDDILSLARVGRPSDPLERSELSALVISVVEEFEDMGDPVELGETPRMAFPLRVTWLRRALRNLISNAVRYGKAARVSLARDGQEAVIRIEDDGPGIPDHRIADMLEPFTRGDPSRNSETGGAGLGLTLARAIAEQHGGSLRLENRHGADGAILGLTATLRLPLG